MSTLTVGTNEEYSTISAAIAASSSGDTIDVDAGTYANDFLSIDHDLNLVAVGGTVNLVATVEPPNGKGIIDEGGSGVTVSITDFDISGATVTDGNGAGIRYEGGTLTLTNDTIHGNQDGLLANSDAAGAITINGSTFYDNGAGDGYTHNIYVGAIASLLVENSTITSADVGHDIKSRAASTTVIGNTITDGTTGTASYEIDVPNGGAAVIEGNVIEKGANAQNPIAISYGEEGSVYANSSLTISGNQIINDDLAHSTTALVNDTDVTATVSDNTLYGWSAVTSGPATVTGTATLTTEPSLSSLVPSGATTSTGTSSTSSGSTTTGTSTGSTSSGSTATDTSASVTDTTPVTLGSGSDTLALSVAEDAWDGDAQFTVAINGQTIAGVYTATASHAAGATQDVSISGDWGTGVTSVAISFINDAYGGTATTDRNLYVDQVTYDGENATGTPLAIMSDGTTNVALPASAPITLHLAEDAWNGNAQYSVAVDGTTIVQDGAVTASNALGQSQAVNLQAALTPGVHDLAISFVNDAYGGTASTDRNLYVTGINVNGTALSSGTATLLSTGTDHFQIVIPTS